MSELVSMAITDTTDNEDEYAEISDIYDIPVVSCSWVVASHSCGKLLPTKPFPPKLTSNALFKGKVFCASHIPNKSDLNSLWAMVTFHGGATRRRLSSEVTHLICTTTIGKKFASASSYPSLVVVTPDWVVECIQSKKLMEETEFHPKLLVNSSCSSPALRRQLLSPTAPLPAEGKKKTIASPSPSKPKPKTPSMFQVPSTTSPSSALGFLSPSTPLNPGYPAASHTARNRPPRPKLHEMPSGYPPGGFQQEPTTPQHTAQPMMNVPSHMQRHPYRPQISAQHPDPVYPPQNYGVPAVGMMGNPAGQMPVPSAHHQVC